MPDSFSQYETREELSTKITMVVFWALVIIGLSFAGLLLNNIENDTYERRSDKANSMAHRLSQLSFDIENERASISGFISMVVSPDDRFGMQVYRDNRVIAAINDQLLQGEVDSLVRTFNIMTDNNETVSYRLTIFFPNLDETIRYERKRLLIILGSLLLVFGFLLKRVLERMIKTPVENMVDTARAITAGNRDVEFNEARGDELGYLSSFINRAIKSLNDQESQIIRAKELAEVTLKSINDSVISTDNNGNVVFMNERAEQVLNTSLEKEKGRKLEEVTVFIDEDTGERIKHPIHMCLIDEVSVDLKTNYALVSSSGEYLPVSCSLAPIHDNQKTVFGAVMVFQDVSETRDLHKELSYQASHDHLTGLYNRREFEQELEYELALAKRDGFEHALCYIDLDEFKVVNDTCGHVAGDQLLRKLADYLHHVLRKTDVFARLGGDEFAILLKKCSEEEAKLIAENVLQAINEFRFTWQDKRFRVGASIGIAIVNIDSKDANEVLANADLACYEAKDRGRNRIETFQDNDSSLNKRRLEMGMISAVREALDEDRFALFVQPIVPVQNIEKIERYEILIRMETTDGKILTPGSFLPAAERYRLMTAIDRWVVSKVFECMAKGLNNQCLVCINISAQSINDRGFLSFIIDEIDKMKINGAQLCFEITESEAVNNMDEAIKFMNALKQRHCMFALDDFGTGVSSFEYLKNLPIDYLKIDGSFINNIDKNKIDYAMVKAIHDVATVMGMKTVAEFVENENIHKVLREIGIDYAQGHWIQQPKTILDFLEKETVVVSGSKN